MAFSTASPFEEPNVSCEIGTGASLVLTASASDLVVPVAEEYHVQEYLSKRTALLAEEKMLRHDFAFKLSMSPKVHQAAAIVSRIRAQEIQNLRLNSVEGSRRQMLTTQLYQRIRDMPKGALLHAPLEQMVDVDWLIDRMFAENDSGNAASCMVIFLPNADRQAQQHPSIELRFLGPDTLRKLPICPASEAVWTETRDKLVLCSLKEVAQYFPRGGQTGLKAFLQQTWENTLTTRADSAPGSAASCSFLSILLYEPILRTAVSYVSQKLRQAHFSYAELRLTLPNDDLCPDVDNPVNWHRICHVIQEAIDIGQRDSTTPLIRLIWTSPLNPNSENIRKGMEHCMLAKKSFPRLICGYDFVQRQHSQPLLDFLPLILGFQQMTRSERVNIPLGFDVGGCLDDGCVDDQNLIDAVLLGTRWLGCGSGLHHHPRLMKMVKEQDIAIGYYPTFSAAGEEGQYHSLLGLLSRGLPVVLRGFGSPTLTHSFLDPVLLVQSIGLDELGAMAESSIRWSNIDDVEPSRWLQSVRVQPADATLKAMLLKQWQRDLEQFCTRLIRESAQHSKVPAILHRPEPVEADQDHSDYPPLRGLPSVANIHGTKVPFGPCATARRAALVYSKLMNITHPSPAFYTKINEERSYEIARLYDDLVPSPHDPETKACYSAFCTETLLQYRIIRATGLQVSYTPGYNPYPNPRQAILDVQYNNHLYVEPTDHAFGDTVFAEDPSNPLLQCTDELIDGRRARFNDIFRIVHDYFSHVREGLGFRAEGEDNAWRCHAVMYSKMARRAMTTELRGQNTWINYGPYRRKNRTAKMDETHYAPQKVGLMPEWVSWAGVEDGDQKQTIPSIWI